VLQDPEELRRIADARRRVERSEATIDDPVYFTDSDEVCIMLKSAYHK
jgi:hypothetical protein